MGLQRFYGLFTRVVVVRNGKDDLSESLEWQNKGKQWSAYDADGSLQFVFDTEVGEGVWGLW